MLVCLSPREAPTRKSGEPTSMRFPRLCHRQNLHRLSTCRITVVWSVGPHPALSGYDRQPVFHGSGNTLQLLYTGLWGQIQGKMRCASSQCAEKSLFSPRSTSTPPRIFREIGGMKGSQIGCGNRIHRHLCVGISRCHTFQQRQIRLCRLLSSSALT